MLALSAVLLAGCAAPAPIATPTPTVPYVEPVVDPLAWEYDATFEEFVAAFPDLDTAPLAELPDLVVMHNDRAWSLGSGSGGFYDARAWAAGYAAMTPVDPDEEDETNFRGAFSNEDRSISFDITEIGADDFLLIVTSSE